MMDGNVEVSRLLPVRELLRNEKFQQQWSLKEWLAADREAL